MKVTYGLGWLASAMFAVAIAHAQTGGGSAAGGGAAGGSSATSSSSTGTSASGTAAPSSTGTTSRGSSGLGASSPSNLSGGAAGTTSTATGTGANVGRAGVGAGGLQGTQPGTTPGLTGQRSALPPAQRSTLNQGNFTQRNAAEQQLLLDQQRSAAARTQSGLTQGQSQFTDQQTLQQREALGEQQAAGRLDAMRDDSTMRSDTTQRSGTMITGNAPGELGVFVAEGPERGVTISRIVTGSAAADAGLQPGDIIVGVGEQLVASPSDLTRLIRATRAGEIVQLQVVRGDAEYDVDATLQPFRSQPSYDVGYRGSATVTSGDLASRVERLEEQLSMILDELRTVREQVVVLRGGSSESADFDSRLRSETRTGMQTEFGEGSTRDGFSSGFESRETRQGIGTEFDQRSSESFDSERGPVSGVDARSETSIDARSTQPGTDQRDAGATDRSATPPSTDDDPLGLNDSQPSTPPQRERPATGDEDAQQSQTEAGQELPF